MTHEKIPYLVAHVCLGCCMWFGRARLPDDCEHCLMNEKIAYLVAHVCLASCMALSMCLACPCSGVIVLSSFSPHAGSCSLDMPNPKHILRSCLASEGI